MGRDGDSKRLDLSVDWFLLVSSCFDSSMQSLVSDFLAGIESGKGDVGFFTCFDVCSDTPADEATIFY